MLGHEQQPPAQRAGRGVGASSKQVHDGEQKVVLVEVAAAEPRLLWEAGGDCSRREEAAFEVRPHLQTLHVDHERVHDASAPLGIEGLLQMLEHLQVPLQNGST